MDYNHLRGRRKSTALPRMLLAGFIVLVIGGASFIFYEYKAHPEWVEKITIYREQIGTWLAERKKSMHHGVGRVGKVADAQEDGDKPVNFEFYDTLQDMKSMQAEAHADAQRKIAEKSSQETSAKKPKIVKASHAADLEKDLLTAIKQAGGRE